MIGANSEAIPELIQNGLNGLLYDTGNPITLADKIELLYKDRDLRELLEVNAYQWSNKNFSSEKYASALLEVFRDTVKKPT